MYNLYCALIICLFSGLACSSISENELVGFAVSHSSGFYEKPFRLVVKSEYDVYYTTDGSVPDTNSIPYSEPIDLDNLRKEPITISHIPTTPMQGKWHLEKFKWKPVRDKLERGAVILRFKEFNRGKEVSEGQVYSYSYFVDSGIRTRHSFPVVSIAIDTNHLFNYETGIYTPGILFDQTPWNDSVGDFWPPGNYREKGKKWERDASVQFFERDGKLGFDVDAGIRIHGAVIGGFPVKSLRISMREKYGDTVVDYPLFENMTNTRFKRLLLRNSGNDFLDTYFRDALLHDILSPLDVELQGSRPVVVYINGEYWGIHNLREKLDKHYLNAHFGVMEDDLQMVEVCGAESHGSPDDFLRIYQFTPDSDLSVDSNYNYIAEQIDMSNYIDYNLAQIYFGNLDWPANNVKTWKTTDPTSKWRWMVFDLDWTFGYQQLGVKATADYNSLADAVEEGSKKWYNADCSTLLLRNLFKNENFRKLFVSRYLELSKTVFATANIIAKIDAYEKMYESEMEEHINRWNYPNSMEEWRRSIEEMRVYARERPVHFNTHLEEYLNISLNQFTQ